jgi:hypothetical protein
LSPAPALRAERVWGGVLLAGYAAVRVALEGRYRLFDPDEALEMLAAGSLREGKLPYLGALSHRGPLLTFLYAVPCGLFGPYAYRAVHAFCTLLFVAIAVWFQRSIARATSERVGLLALGNLLLLATLRVPTEDNWGLNSDFLMAGFVIAAMCLLLSSRPYAGVGLVLALAVLTKQNAVPYVLVPIAHVGLFDRDHALQKLWRLAYGFVLPIAMTGLLYAAAGQLNRAWYFFYEYNRDYAAAAYDKGAALALLIDARWILRSYGELLALGGVGVMILLRSRERERVSVWSIALVWALAGIGAAVAPGKTWDNYLWASHAPVALFAALGADSILSVVDRGRWRTASKKLVSAAVIAMPLLGCATQVGRGWTVLASATEVGGIPPPRVPRRELLDILARVTSVDDAIYVTGYAPEMYVLAKRHPASRHVISNFVENVYPGRFSIPSKISPRFFDELREDLAQSRPRVILDACGLGFLCHPASALTEALPQLLDDYHTLSEGPPGVYFRND